MPLDLQPAPKIRTHPEIDRAFGGAQGDAGAVGELAGIVHGGSVHIVCRQYPVGHADRKRFLGPHLAAGVDQFLCTRDPYEAREPLRPSGARNNAELNLRLPELGGVGGIAKVGAQREFVSTTERVPVDRRDRYLRNVFNQIERVLQFVNHRTGLRRRKRLHHRDVRARREDPLAAPDHNRTDVIVRGDFAGGIGQLASNLVVDRIELRTVEPDRSDAVLDFQANEFTHGRSSSQDPASGASAARRSPASPATDPAVAGPCRC